MKKNIILIALLLASGLCQTFARGTAYRIQLKFTDLTDSVVFLAHYYGKPLPTIYKRDSVRLDHKGVGIMQSDDSDFVGGIYIVLLNDKKSYFEVLMNKGDDMSIVATAAKLPESVEFKNSPENKRFQDYVEFLKEFNTKQEGFKKQLQSSKTAADTVKVRKEATKYSKDLINYRHDYVKKYPGTLLANIFNALELPQVPEGNHFLEDGVTKDSNFAYTYYKAHFWDGFNFQDDRLIHTPILDSKLDEYFNKEVLPWPDSVKHECDVLLAKARGTKDLFKYVLWWTTRFAEDSKIMGMDEAFIYLVENYYMKGDAFWLTPDELSKYEERVQKMAPNVIGNIAPEVKVPNIYTKKMESMLDLKAKYTLLVFYSPTCGHCQHEMPILDSLYEADLKHRDVKIFTVATEGDEQKITDFLTGKLKVDKKWTNCWDPDHVGDWRNKYDVYSTPTIYLLDEKKKIVGKRIDHTNIVSLIEREEKKQKDKEKEKSKK